MENVFKAVWKVLTSVVVTAVVLLTVLLVGFRLMGLQLFAVMSGSMEPTYPVGSVIYVDKVEADQIQSGDVITFKLKNGTVVTHRVTEVIQEPDGRLFITKGDANPMEDAYPVSENQIIGKSLFCVPYLGHFSSYLQTPVGMYTAIGVAAGMLLLVFFPDLFFDKKE